MFTKPVAPPKLFYIIILDNWIFAAVNIAEKHVNFLYRYHSASLVKP